MKSYFVTGIGTGVGKTLAAAILTEALQADYWKPIQSGNKEGSDSYTVKDLISNQKSIIHPESYSFREPLSPHQAAALERVEIDLSKIILPKTSSSLVIEGAGGLLVPLNKQNFVIELAARFKAEVVLVVRNYLGCINHSLLSLDYLKQHGYPIAGIILNGSFDPAVSSVILNYGQVPLLLEIPDLNNIDKTSVKEISGQLKISNG